MRKPPRFIINLLSWLLGLANSSPPGARRWEFYQIKAKLLQRFGSGNEQSLFGLRPEMDLQHIRKPCFNCDGTGIYRDFDKEPCRKCSGTGTFDEFWVFLERWHLGSRVFHIPLERVREKPERAVTIEGLIRHESAGRSAKEARLWLYLLFDRDLFRWEMMHGMVTMGFAWHPLISIQQEISRVRAAARVCHRGLFEQQKCWHCEKIKRMWHYTRNYAICKQCCREVYGAGNAEEVPF